MAGPVEIKGGEEAGSAAIAIDEGMNVHQLKLGDPVRRTGCTSPGWFSHCTNSCISAGTSQGGGGVR